MTAILDFHHYVELMDDPDAHAARFVGIWKQIAARYHDRPASLLYELLNEPTSKITAPKWNALLVTALAAVREVDPTRKVIVDSVFWAAAKELANLELPASDTNLIASFHMYQPILFTHQGMPFMTAEYGTIGIPFPGPATAPIAPVPGALKVDWVADWFRRYNSTPAAENPGGPSAVLAEFAMARAFAERTKRPLYMGEFGTGDVIDIASRALDSAGARGSRAAGDGLGLLGRRRPIQDLRPQDRRLEPRAHGGADAVSSAAQRRAPVGHDGSADSSVARGR